MWLFCLIWLRILHCGWNHRCKVCIETWHHKTNKTYFWQRALLLSIKLSFKYVHRYSTLYFSPGISLLWKDPFHNDHCSSCIPGMKQMNLFCSLWEFQARSLNSSACCAYGKIQLWTLNILPPKGHNSFGTVTSQSSDEGHITELSKGSIVPVLWSVGSVPCVNIMRLLQLLLLRHRSSLWTMGVRIMDSGESLPWGK